MEIDANAAAAAIWMFSSLSWILSWRSKWVYSLDVWYNKDIAERKNNFKGLTNHLVLN